MVDSEKPTDAYNGWCWLVPQLRNPPAKAENTMVGQKLLPRSPIVARLEYQTFFIFPARVVLDLSRPFIPTLWTETSRYV